MNVDAEITLAEVPGLAAHDAILDRLLAFNAAHAAPSDRRPLAVLLRAPGGELLGGLWGETARGWLCLELLFVPEGLRGLGLGTRLVRRAEDEARARGCHGAWLRTFEFQARGFYERLGYAVFGELVDCPPGHRCYFMRKTLPGGVPSDASGTSGRARGRGGGGGDRPDPAAASSRP
jgi:GNAT superfamily N-acetyltransferase